MEPSITVPIRQAAGSRSGYAADRVGHLCDVVKARQLPHSLCDGLVENVKSPRPRRTMSGSRNPYVSLRERTRSDRLPKMLDHPARHLLGEFISLKFEPRDAPVELAVGGLLANDAVQNVGQHRMVTQLDQPPVALSGLHLVDRPERHMRRRETVCRRGS